MPGVAKFVGEGEHVGHGAFVGEKDARLFGVGEVGAVCAGGAVGGGLAVYPTFFGHHDGEVSHFGGEVVEGFGNEGDRIVKRNLFAFA